MGFFFSDGSFAAATRQVLWLAAFFAGLAACAVGISYPPQASAFVLPDSCTAGVAVYNKLYLSCFAAFTSSTVQASSVSIAMLILGSTKRLDQLPPPSSSGRCCRCCLLVGVFFCLLSFSALVCVVDLVVFVKVGRFDCLTLPAKLLVVAGDALAALCGMAICAAGSYIACFCN